ncbi:TetR/AcrR family transcriptional regulator [Luminiphilus sp.]|nr:TetR/AcrR family transcriptional regulator [Luminiphilus sp.]
MSDFLKPDSEGRVDGRRLRSERSRLAFVDAVLVLQEEGVLVPTAQQIADRAGVGIRSFFRHFEDMESLFKAIDDHIRDSYEALFISGDRSGTLEERIDGMVRRRADAFESVTNITQGTRAQLWRYQTLRDNYARNQRGLRKDLDNLLPELHALPDETRESIDAITSFEMWDRLRSHQGLNKADSINLLRTLLKNVMAAEREQG